VVHKVLEHIAANGVCGDFTGVRPATGWCGLQGADGCRWARSRYDNSDGARPAIPDCASSRHDSRRAGTVMDGEAAQGVAAGACFCCAASGRGYFGGIALGVPGLWDDTPRGGAGQQLGRDGEGFPPGRWDRITSAA
jgi:hypothetical protein